jgi:multidrug efflux system membrane fusion protein
MGAWPEPILIDTSFNCGAIGSGVGVVKNEVFGRLETPQLKTLELRAGALAALCAAAGGACARSQGAPPPGRGGAAPALVVRVAPVSVQDVVFAIKSLGSLEPEEMVQVTAEVEGSVSEVRFHEGDRVGPGTVLVLIDQSRYKLEADRAEAGYKKALADQHRAEADLKRREELAQENLVPFEELNRSRQEAERLEAETAAVKAARDIALQNLRRAAVRPPQAGVINTKNVETGQFVKMGNVLATLVDTSRLRLRFKVSESQSLRAQEGQDVSFRVAALGDRDFTARIYHVGEVADPSTRQVEVLAWVKNPGILKPGFFAEVTLASESHKGALVVPEGAIQASERGFVTYVVEDGRARLRTVQIGLRTDKGLVELLSGVKAGESVVIEGSDRLADGVPVQAVGATPMNAGGGK